jgi:cytochrome oxidase Cu insertion factor (SCO1/SenC/PrrC family)
VSSNPRRNTIAALVVAAPLALGLLIAVIAHLAGGGEEAEVTTPTGTALEPTRRTAVAPAAAGTPAPRVRLAEAGTGRSFDSSSLGSDPYAVVFVAVGCGPIGDYLGRAGAELRSSGSGAAILAISADPATDTPKAAAAFVAEHGLSAPVHFLLGSEAELQGLWNAWGFGAPSPTCGENVPAHLVAGSGENAGVVDLDPRAPTTILTDALAGMLK